MSDNSEYALSFRGQTETNTILFLESGAFIKVSSDGVATVSDHFSTEDAAKLLGCISDAWNRQQAKIARLHSLIKRLRHVETYEVHTGYDNGCGGGNYVYEPAVLMSDDVIRDLLAALEQKP